MKGTVLVTSRTFGSGDLDPSAELKAAGLRVQQGRADHGFAPVNSSLDQVVAWIAGTGPITASHLDALPGLRVIARYGVGVDAVDLGAAAERGIVVTNTPGANSGAVADHTMALMLAALRSVVVGDRRRRTGHGPVRRGRDVGDLTVGLVGLGQIGRAVARRLGGFGSTVLGIDPALALGPTDELGVEVVPADELVRRSDVISLHAPGGHVLVDRVWLERVKPTMILVNTARSILVDEQAVADALRAGRLGGYASDVLEGDAGGSGASPLLASDLADLTVFTAHTAGHTVGAIDRMGRGAVDAVLAVLAGRPASSVVVPAPELSDG